MNVSEARSGRQESWTFPWSVLDVMVGGKSSIDLKHLHVSSEQDAEAFLSGYGYSLYNQMDKKRLHEVFIESLNFIAKVLMPVEWKEGLQPPREIFQAVNAKKLLVWASQKDKAHRKWQAWSCAILRLMHTIAHIDGVERDGKIEIAREQIMQRFASYFFRDECGQLFFGTHAPRAGVPIDRMEWKHSKTRESIILKLLHKPANVAETIYDLLGFRIVTKHLSDTLLVVKYLTQFNLIIFPNNIPARARNNLVDLEAFQKYLQLLTDQLNIGLLSQEEFEERMRLFSVASQSKNSNPHSSEGYRSIQLTCRQRILFKDYEPQTVMRMLKKIQDEAFDITKYPLLQDLMEYVRLDGESSLSASFFPFEVQILDKKAADAVNYGEASHLQYKKSQIRTARRRILHDVLRLDANYKEKN